jgi:chemotaxis protein MotB
VTGTMGAGEVTASLDSDVLFDSGKTTLKPTARQSLDKVAAVLNSTYGGRSIRIAGHTDTDPIRKSGFKSNYHLGFERAFAVREYLISKGVPSNRIHLASFGPDLPRGSKAQSRRVEIVVVLN